jgi:hypothetical protein
MSEILSFFNTCIEAVDRTPVFCELQKHSEQARNCASSAAQLGQMLDWAYPRQCREAAKGFS